MYVFMYVCTCVCLAVYVYMYNVYIMNFFLKVFWYKYIYLITCNTCMKLYNYLHSK